MIAKVVAGNRVGFRDVEGGECCCYGGYRHGSRCERQKEGLWRFSVHRFGVGRDR